MTPSVPLEVLFALGHIFVNQKALPKQLRTSKVNKLYQKSNSILRVKMFGTHCIGPYVQTEHVDQPLTRSRDNLFLNTQRRKMRTEMFSYVNVCVCEFFFLFLLFVFTCFVRLSLQVCLTKLYARKRAY